MIDPLPSDLRHGHPPTQFLKASELVLSATVAGACQLTTTTTPLHMMHNQVRNRVGSKHFSIDGDPILDEQEQDEVIEDIRHQMVQLDHEYRVGIGIIAILSCVLHIIYLFNPLRPPTAILFSIPDTYSPIPLHTMFTSLHLFLQGYLSISAFHPPSDRNIRTLFSTLWSNMQTSTRWIPSVNPHLFPLLVSSIAPILCILLYKGWADFIWWCFCGALFSMRLFAQRGRQHDEARIEALEKLKYHAKGA